MESKKKKTEQITESPWIVKTSLLYYNLILAPKCLDIFCLKFVFSGFSNKLQMGNIMYSSIKRFRQYTHCRFSVTGVGCDLISEGGFWRFVFTHPPIVSHPPGGPGGWGPARGGGNREPLRRESGLPRSPLGHLSFLPQCPAIQLLIGPGHNSGWISTAKRKKQQSVRENRN